MLTLFGITKHHPRAFVIVVDNASSPPLALSIPLQVQKRHKKSMVILRQDISKYEYGAFNAGLKFLSAARGPWALENFERFYFMQAQIYLHEPVGAIRRREGDKKCEFGTMMTGGAPETLEDGSTEGKMMAEYLSKLGLYHELGKLTNSDKGAVHSAFVATLEGAKQLLATGALDANWTTKDTAIVYEQLTGILLNRLSRKHGGGDDCARFGVQVQYAHTLYTPLTLCIL
jgi:hypothetical protein